MRVPKNALLVALLDLVGSGGLFARLGPCVAPASRADMGYRKR